MNSYLADLGKKVEAARLERGWSKEFAAREAKISAITWKRVEDGLGVQDAKRAAVLKVLELDEQGNATGGAVVEPTEGDPVREGIAAAPRLGPEGRDRVLNVYDFEVNRHGRAVG